MFRGKKVKEQKAPSPEINMKRGEMAEESKGNVQSILLSSPDKPIRQSKLPGTPDLENMEPMLFHRDMDDEDDEEAQEDAKILNMSLIRGILGQSSNRLEDSPLTSPDRDDPYSPSKKVSFQQDVGSVASSQADEEKTHDELVNKIGKLQAKLTHAGIDNSAEKAMRRKKEKSLVKLAKELNKRSTDQQGKEVIINELKGKLADLEAKLAATRSEMDERIATNEKKTKDYNDQLDDAHRKYRTVVAENDVNVAELAKAQIAETEGLRRSLKETEMECERLRTHIGTVREQIEVKTADSEKMVQVHKNQLAEAHQKLKDTVAEHDNKVSVINKKHENQIDDLRHQLLAANLECDKIRTDLASHQMMQSPEMASEIVTRTMRSASNRGRPVPKKKLEKVLRVLRIMVAIIVALLACAYPLDLLSMNAMCAPAMPGTTFGTEDASFEAPWWAPASMKESAFAICDDRRRTSLKWSNGRLVVAEVGTSKVLLEKRSYTAVVQGSVVQFFNKNSKIETLRSPWAR